MTRHGWNVLALAGGAGIVPGGVRTACCNSAIFDPASRWSARLAAWLDVAFIVSGLALMAGLKHNYGDDGAVRHDALEALLQGHLSHQPFSLVVPLLAVPLDVLGRAIGSDSAEYGLNQLLFAGSLVAIWLLLRDRVPGELLRGFLLLLVFGSLFPPAVVSFYGETATATLVAVGLLAVVVGSRAPTRVAGWAAVAIGVANTPALLPGLAIVVVIVVVARRSLWPVVALGAAVCLTVVDIRLHTGRFGSPYAGDHGLATVLPYSGLPGFSYPALFGVLAIVFSLGKGLLFFTPGLFLPVREALDGMRPLRRTRILWLVVVVCVVAVYCRWWAWYGGVFFGPRFFLIASFPASLALAVRLRTPFRSLAGNVLTLLALTVSIWVGVVGAMGVRTDETCTADGYALEHLCWYTPEFGALTRPFVDWPAQSTSSVLFGLLGLAVLVRLGAQPVRELVSRLRDEGARIAESVTAGRTW
jgi:hypothetical protein